MSDRLNLYKESARLCASTDYSSKADVRAHNRAADRMRALVETAAVEGEAAVAELFPLLDDEIAAPWIAHHLMEFCDVPVEIEQRCLGLIERLAQESVGDRIWLKNYRGRH